MQNLKPTFISTFIAFLFLLSCQNDSTTVQTSEGEQTISTEEFLATMGEAYMYGYPLVIMDLTKKMATNIEGPHPELPRAPINQLGHFRRFPDHNMKGVVKPNVDTYYSIAWLDLKKEPLVFSIPATERYCLFPFMDAYSNVIASPGTRTTGTEAKDIFVAGPDWKGEKPDSMELVQSSTNMVWLLGRIQVNSAVDGATRVRSIQDSLKLVPFSAFGQKGYRPPAGEVDTTQKDFVPVKAIQELDYKTYFNRMAELLVDNPPPARDSAMLRKMAKIGIVPGQPFDFSTDNLILKTKLGALPGFIHKKFAERRANPDPALLTNGWMVVKEDIGTYGMDYTRRAYIDFIGLGANIPEDAVYPNCTLDINREPLRAEKKYQIHFEKEQLPPVRAFWSLTAYNADEFLVENELNRFALGDRDELTFNEDGSLDLYIQNEKPAKEKMSNWLPIPKEGLFSLTMRLYWPEETVMNGSWKVPGVVPIN